MEKGEIEYRKNAKELLKKYGEGEEAQVLIKELVEKGIPAELLAERAEKVVEYTCPSLSLMKIAGERKERWFCELLKDCIDEAYVRKVCVFMFHPEKGGHCRADGFYDPNYVVPGTHVDI